MNPSDRPDLPAVLIAGYLGAGKTTLVNHLLREAGGRRIAVLVNDFGAVNIDADLIEDTAGGGAAGVIGLAGGCLCCSFGDDLVGTLASLTRREPPPDMVLVELSGVALPAAVARSARLARGIAVIGTLCVADGADVRRQAADRYVGDTVRQQLREADWVLLNKPDLLSADALRENTRLMAELAPQARVMACAAAELPAELVLGWRGEGDGEEHRPRAAAFAPRPIGTGRSRAGDLFASCALPLPDGTDLEALAQRLAAPDSGVLRAKGLAVDADGRGRLLQLAGARWSVTPARVQGSGRLVLIGLRAALDEAYWAATLSAAPSRAAG